MSLVGTQVVPSLMVFFNEGNAGDIEELSNADLMKYVDELDKEVVYMEIENEVFECYLSKNEPLLLVGYYQYIRILTNEDNSSDQQLSSSPSKLHMDISLTALFGRKPDSRSATTPEKPYRLNLSTKMELVMNELEERKSSFEEMVKKTRKKKSDLKAELEEVKIRTAEVEEALNTFEKVVVIEGKDPLTQRIPAERFIRFMEEWLRKADVTIGKMRLRTSTLKTQFRKVAHLISQKKYLGETVHAVDFDKIRIENTYLMEKIEQKTAHMLELKQINGEANLMLANFKKYLLKQMSELDKVKKEIMENERKIKDLETQGNLAEQEVEKQEEKLQKMMYITEHYKVPEVIQYVKKKAELLDLKKSYKTWIRKNKLEMYSLNQIIEKMKKLTGSKKQRQSWFSLQSTYSGLTLASDDYFGLPIPDKNEDDYIY
ncbi:coiled-coil domain-containing protein 113-like [Agrilus planipennis]|uniref:Cilia- and flagella-associated protein 263 n=1 Tax=Agrilus planipennis TaxID=224129 RepID=A0A1W4XKN5_AGRPL|nr:coiled-coil domain-containing protein 113-like [Agrilus planipennis]